MISLWKDILKAIKKVGFWNNENNDYPDLPMPKENSPNYDVEKMTAYLNDCPTTFGYRGASPCRICGIPNGGMEKYDGVYVWPNGLSHYTEDHEIELPQDFVNHVESNGYDCKKAVDSIGNPRTKKILSSIMQYERAGADNSTLRSLRSLIDRGSL